MKHPKFDDGPIGPVLAPAVDASAIPDVTRKTILGVDRDHRWYHKVVDDDGDRTADVLADVTDDLGNIISQEALWETGDDSLFTANDHLVVSMALERLSKTVPASGLELVDLVRNRVHDIQTSREATKKV